MALELLLHLHRVRQVHDLAELVCDLATDDHYASLAFKLQSLVPGLPESELWPLRRDPSDAEAEVTSLVLGEIACGGRALDSLAGQQILSVLQLQIYEIPPAMRSLQHLVKNRSMAQAELLRHLLVGLLQEVVLGPTTCLAVLLAAEGMGLRQLQTAAMQCARASFPACAADSSTAFFALPAGTVKHLLQYAMNKEGQEVKCFNALAAWIQADAESRAPLFLELFGCIKLERVRHPDLMRMDQHRLVYHNREATCKIAWAWLQRCGSTVPTPAEEPPSPHRHPGHPRRNRTNILSGHHSGAARFYRRHQQEQPSTHHPFHAADLDVSHPLDPETLPSSSAAGPSDPLSTCLLHMSLEAGPGPSAPPVGPSAPPMGPSPPMGSVGPQVGAVSLPGGSSGLPGALPMILDTDSFPSASPKYPTGWQWPLSTPRRAGRSAASAGSPERPHRLERSARPERHDRAKRARRIQPPDACQSLEGVAGGSEAHPHEAAEIEAICKELTLEEEMAASPTRLDSEADDAMPGPSERATSSRRKLF